MNGLYYSNEKSEYFLIYNGREITSNFIEVNDEFLNIIGYRISFIENGIRPVKKRNILNNNENKEFLISYLSKLAAINYILSRKITSDMKLFFDFEFFCMEDYNTNKIVKSSLSNFGLNRNISFIINKGNSYNLCWKKMINELNLTYPKKYEHNVSLSFLNDMSFSYHDISGIKLCIKRLNRLGLAVIVENVHCLEKLRALKYLGVHYFS